jgi:uncharacterized lipoprotein YmbA
MNLQQTFLRTALFVAVCALPAGCLFNPAQVTTRQFILSPVRMEASSAPATGIALGLGAVRMPDYLQRSALAVRRSEREIEYLENAVWAERLDRSFQRALAADLQSQLPGSRVRLSTWLGDEVAVALFVQVDRFEVARDGRGTLLAHWQLESPDRRHVLKTGAFRREHAGPAPHPHPEAVATTLSELTAQLAAQLAPEIRAAAAR